MQVEYDTMVSRKVQLKQICRTAEKEVAEAEKQLRNVEQYLGIEKDGHEKQSNIEKQEVSL